MSLYNLAVSVESIEKTLEQMHGGKNGGWLDSILQSLSGTYCHGKLQVEAAQIELCCYIFACMLQCYYRTQFVNWMILEQLSWCTAILFQSHVLTVGLLGIVAMLHRSWFLHISLNNVHNFAMGSRTPHDSFLRRYRVLHLHTRLSQQLCWNLNCFLLHILSCSCLFILFKVLAFCFSTLLLYHCIRTGNWFDSISYSFRHSLSVIEVSEEALGQGLSSRICWEQG